jgi:hypothetical protein
VYSTVDEIEWLASHKTEEYADLIQRLKRTGTEFWKLRITEAVNQVGQLTDLTNDYHSVVETRFLGKKHMPLEYLSAARQVQKHAVQNLADVVTIGHSLSAIDNNNADSSRATIPGSDSPDAQLARAEKNTDLYYGHQQRLNELLNINREMFDALT